MAQTIDLKQLERRAFLTYHEDGLFDIAIGAWLFIMGLCMGAGKPTPLIIFSPAFLLGLAGAKKIVTVPRIGYVNFGPTR